MKIGNPVFDVFSDRLDAHPVPREVAHLDRQRGAQVLQDGVGIVDAKGAGQAQVGNALIAAQQAGTVAAQLADEVGQAPLDHGEHAFGPGTGTGGDVAGRTEVLAVDGLLASETEAGYHPQRIVTALAGRGLHLLFVEGGGITVSRFFTAGALDRLHLVVAPVLIGNGRRGLQAPAQAVMADCPRPKARTLALGPDMLWDLELRSA